ncbi:MAG: response regulator, partial [Desulfobacteraceae bacterium]|nr:response regulator [Desulfobacteraceae bacterium]
RCVVLPSGYLIFFKVSGSNPLLMVFQMVFQLFFYFSCKIQVITDLISVLTEDEALGKTGRLKPKTLEIEADCKNGSTKWLEINASLFRDPETNISRIIGVTRDISEKKGLKKEKEKMVIQLQQAQKMEAIGTLAGGIAHDFNNILSAIIGYTELVLDEIKKDTLQYKNLQEILVAGNRAKNLVQQILMFSRQADQEQIPFQVKLVVKEVLKMLRASIPSTIEIDQSVKSNALVMGDSTQVHQVIMNLCTNAAHAMAENGGVLTVSLSDAELDSEFCSNHPGLSPGQYIILTVTDTGHGMSPDVLKQIFDPFFTTKEKGTGTGMGLSVVHGIVNSHQGKIFAYSEAGEGTSFRVFLPIVTRRFTPENKIEKPIPTGTERILFIDDERVIVNMGKQMLGSLGYDVVPRTNGVEALDLFKAQIDLFDLVITDMTMPHLTGDALARELFKIRSDIPIIVCSGFSARMDEKEALATGIQAFITKPILKRDLAETVRAVLDKRKRTGGGD